ncbi:MAG: hypothetical protein V4581_09505 [Bacteroidota bacterium]
MKNLLLLASALYSFMVHAQNDLPNREAFTLKLAVNNEQFYEENIDKTPYFVTDKVLQIFPGEKLFIETVIKADTIASMKVVKEIKFPERTITLDFKQETDGNTHRRMQLEVENPFDQHLSYSANMFIVGRNEWVYTSIIPVFPKISGIEMWNNVIISLALYDWHFEKHK